MKNKIPPPRQAIQVKYLPATNTQGDRLKAFAAAGSITRGRNYGLNVWQQAYYLAEEFAEIRGWLDGMRLAQGVIKNGDYVFVLVWEKS